MAHRVRMHLLKRRLLFTYLLYTKVVHVLLFPMHTLTECELFTQNVDGVLYVYLFGQVVHTCSSHGYIHNSLHNMAVPRIRLSTVGKRAFPVSGATVWNDLPPTSHQRRHSRLSDSASSRFCSLSLIRTFTPDSQNLHLCGPSNN